MLRRKFIFIASGLTLSLCVPLLANGKKPLVKGVVQVFGDGAKLSAIVIDYGSKLKENAIHKSDFKVQNRSITDIYVNDSGDLDEKSSSGRYVILKLSLNDKNIDLKKMVANQNVTNRSNPHERGGKKWVAGDRLKDKLIFETPKASVYIKDKKFSLGKVSYPIVDDFLQLRFEDKETKKILKYNLYIPKNSDKTPLPLVLFMHDAGVTSDFWRATLLQGLGAISWASPSDQAKRPCFVLAPQYDEIIVDDSSRASLMLDTTINLIKELCSKYAIDTNRIYTTGQSGGCMMSIAMMIKYPTLFAAGFLVAGQWDASLVSPLAKQKLWIMVSADDLGAYPGENAIVAKLEKEGAKVSKAFWNAKWSNEEYRKAFEEIVANHTDINYTIFEKGSVLPSDSDTKRASGHRNTWRVAYSIEPIREWIFKQHRS